MNPDGFTSPSPTSQGTSCSGVSVSMVIPIDASFSRAISWSISCGTGCTSRGSRFSWPRQVLRAQRLVGEAHVHDARRVALGGGQVDQPALAEQEQTVRPSAQRELLHELADRAACSFGQLLQRRDVDLDVEVAGVGRRSRRPSSPRSARSR